mgnify:CR=1 FL=1
MVKSHSSGQSNFKESYPQETFGNLNTLNCDRDSQGDAYFADMSHTVCRSECIEKIDFGLLPQKWMGKKIMPITEKYPIQDLIESAQYYYEKIRRFITFEYVLLKDINDTVNDAKRLANHLKYLPCKLNIIPYNEIDGAYKRPSNQVINAFVNELSDCPFIVTVRWSKGTSIEAGCGQLALKT